MRRSLLLPVALAAACATAEEPVSAWSMGIDEDVTWETVHVLSQASDDSIADEYGEKQVQPVIELRCTEGNGAVDLQIDWQRFVSSFNTEAGFKVDDGNREWIDLGVDDSNRITIARRESDVSALLERMAGGDALSVEIIPYSESSVTVGFSLVGADTALEGLRAACNP